MDVDTAAEAKPSQEEEDVDRAEEVEELECKKSMDDDSDGTKESENRASEEGKGQESGQEKESLEEKDDSKVAEIDTSDKEETKSDRESCEKEDDEKTPEMPVAKDAKEGSDAVNVETPDQAESAETKDETAVTESEATDDTSKENKVESEKKEVEAVVASNELSTEPSANCENAEKQEDMEFVMVDKAEVPCHDSQEVQASLPPAKPEEGSCSTKATVTQSLAPPLTNNTESANKPNGTSAPENMNVEAPSDASCDPLLTRKYVASKDCASYTDVNKHFTIASYNILASIHAIRGFKSSGQYSWSSEDKLAMLTRHSRLMKELDYLAADIAVHLVGKARSHSGTAFNEDIMSMSHQSHHAGRVESDPVFIMMFFFNNRYIHNVSP